MAETTKKTRKPKALPPVQLQQFTREDCPDLIDKILTLLNKEIDNLCNQASLTSEDLKNVNSVAGVVTSIYKEYKDELKTLQKDVNSLSKAEIARLAKQGADK